MSLGIGIPELAIWALLVGRVQEYTTVQQRAVDISNHAVQTMRNGVFITCFATIIQGMLYISLLGRSSIIRGKLFRQLSKLKIPSPANVSQGFR
jgi:hypothetical protein